MKKYSNHIESIPEYKKFYKLNVNTQESLLAAWLIVVANFTTTALVFFQMSVGKTVLMSNVVAAFFAISLIACALLYNLFSLYNFYQRTNLIKTASKHRDTFTNNKINQSQIIYSSITLLITLVQIGIVIVIIQTLLPKLIRRLI